MKITLTTNCDIDGNAVCGFRKEFELPQFILVTRKHPKVNNIVLKPIITKVSEFMKNYIYKIYWSDVYHCLRGRGLIDRHMSVRQFALLVSVCGGDSAEVVRKSGDYNTSGLELLKRKSQIDIITGFIPRK